MWYIINAKAQNSASWCSLFHLFSQKIFEYLLSGSHGFRYWGYTIQSSPTLLDTLVALLACMTIIVAKEACHSMWAVHLFSLAPSNWSIMMNPGPKGELDKCNCIMSPNALSSHSSYIHFTHVWFWSSQPTISFINNAHRAGTHGAF